MRAPRETPRRPLAGPGVPLLLYAALVFLPPLRHMRGGEQVAHAALTLGVPALLTLAWWAGARIVAAFSRGRRAPARVPTGNDSLQSPIRAAALLTCRRRRRV